MNVGVISDTHGLLRPEAVEALRGSDLILHAGDVGSPEVLDALGEIAALVAVRGNNDKAAWAEALPEFDLVQADAALVYMLHDLGELDISPAAAGVGVVVSGHSHRPSVERRHGVLFVNPGSAGPRRFTLPVTLARLSIVGAEASAEIIHLLRHVDSER